ncbi:unnamed protein product, partial [Mesorhabditis belari]|uniref:ABC transporter domain-containing protein n=1 Tax=Mesorhabditis belari TaxID=2138241 RepID=A0AAF3EBL3_9BILA
MSSPGSSGCLGSSPEQRINPFPADHPANLEDVSLLDRVTRETVPFFDLPHRSVSNVTVVPAMEVEWHDVTATINDGPSSSSKAENGAKQKLLDNVFGVARPGEVLAIIGSSGAGKTTLLNALSQTDIRQLRLQGQIKVNNLQVDHEYMRKISAYVQQQDLFIGSLTVSEHLTFVARLRMGKKHNKADQKRRVKTVIRELGLQTVADSIIGTRTRKGISGGEKKRLAFAQEILTSPPILFCDEPTSGLDAFLALQVIKPSSQAFELINRIYVLAEGRVAFCGTQAEAIESWIHFGQPVPLNYNPSDHIIRTLSVMPGRSEATQRSNVVQMCDKFAASTIGKQVLLAARGGEDDKDSPLEKANRKRREKRSGGKYQSSYWQQLSMLCWRQMATSLREPTLLKVQIMHSIVIAILTGLVFAGTPLLQSTVVTINGALFQCVTNMSFMFQFSAVHHFQSEIPVFMREQRNALYRTSPYFLAKNIIEIPTFVFLSMLFCSILYWMSSLVIQVDAFFIYCLVAALVQQSAISVGYFFSCAVPKLPVAMALMPLFVVPMMTFAGFYINQATLPVYFYPLKYLSWFNYGFEALSVNQWSRIDSIPGCESTSCRYPNGTAVLDSLSFAPSNLWRNILFLVALVFTIRLFAFIALYIRVRRNK